MRTKDYRAGFVAFLGEPNAGKSTLLNTLLGDKVSIVSEKPQTTRGRVHGIYSTDRGQIVFVDAPGTIESTSGINEFLRDELNPHRKVLEIVGSKSRTEETVNQLSGIGFSSSGRQQVIVRVTGRTQRVLKITL